MRLIIKPIRNPTTVGASERMNPPIPTDSRPLSTNVMYKRVMTKSSPHVMRPFQAAPSMNAHVFLLLQPLLNMMYANAMALAIMESISETTPTV